MPPINARRGDVTRRRGVVTGAGHAPRGGARAVGTPKISWCPPGLPPPMEPPRAPPPPELEFGGPWGNGGGAREGRGLPVPFRGGAEVPPGAPFGVGGHPVPRTPCPGWGGVTHVRFFWGGGRTWTLFLGAGAVGALFWVWGLIPVPPPPGAGALTLLLPLGLVGVVSACMGEGEGWGTPTLALPTPPTLALVLAWVGAHGLGSCWRPPRVRGDRGGFGGDLGGGALGGAGTRRGGVGEGWGPGGIGGGWREGVKGHQGCRGGSG